MNDNGVYNPPLSTDCFFSDLSTCVSCPSRLPLITFIRPPMLHQGAAIPDTDADRVAVLERLGLLDTPPEECFDRIAKSAAECFQVCG